MDLLRVLAKDRRFHGTCPSCMGDFRLADATLFPVKGPFPKDATERVAEMRTELSERRDELKAKKVRMTKRAERTVHSVNVGNIIEKIVPSFSTFSFSPRDCRALFDPIDYLVFSGMHKTGEVNQISFVDVKSGRARLNKRQLDIRSAVEGGKVEFWQVPRQGTAR